MGKFLSALLSVAKSLGAVIDAAVPVAHGDRTKVSALVAVATPVVRTVVCAVYPAGCSVVDAIGATAAVLVPVFAGAGIVRDKADVAPAK